MANEKILIVDDDENIIGLIVSLLKEENMEIKETCKGKEALPLLLENEFDLLILDLMLGDVDGFEVLKEIRNNFPYLPVLILSARKEIYNKILGLGLGADDYITKPFVREELVARIKANIRRCKILRNVPNKNQLQLIHETLKLDLKEYKLYKNDKEIKLSSRHIKLLKFFMENPKQVFSKEQIYRNVWEDNLYDDNTVMVYIRNLRKIIEDDPDNPYFIKTVWGIGYKFLE